MNVSHESAVAAAQRLAHDVGKYIARTARNVDGAWSTDLVGMLCRDLYELPRGRARVVFESLAKPVDESLGQAALEPVRSLLAEIDRLEAAVRNAEPAAVKRAAHLAREVDDELRELVRKVREPSP